MRKDITITAQPREGRGKNEARRLRVSGWSPAVLYGAEKGSVAIAVNPKEVRKILHSSTGHNTIFNLAMENGESTPVMIIDWQNEPIRDSLLHVDLKRIDLTKRISVKVPVHLKGDSKGVKLQGGLLEVITREVEIDCLPDEIPDQFVMDVTELMINQNIRASDVPLSGSMKLTSSGELVIVHIVSLKAEAVVAVEGVAEPEVVKKGKKEEAGAKTAGADKAAPPTKTAAKTAEKPKKK